MSKALKEFIFPKLTKRTLLRWAIVAAVAFVFFSQVLRPVVVKGFSMEPTYETGGFNFCFKLRYLFSAPERGDIVLVRIGSRVMYLKRVIGVAGDTVEFRNGILYVNSELVAEPYVKLRGGEWNRDPMVVRAGEIFVTGDNRSVLENEMEHGITRTSRIQGAPLW